MNSWKRLFLNYVKTNEIMYVTNADSVWWNLFRIFDQIFYAISIITEMENWVSKIFGFANESSQAATKASTVSRWEFDIYH